MEAIIRISEARALLFGVLRETPIIKEGKYEGNGGDEKKVIPHKEQVFF